jgi:aromatic-L-amino-acid decarboxylase
MDRNHHPHSRDAAELRRLGARAIEIAARHLETLDALPVDRVVPQGERRLLLDQALPEDGLDADAILAFLAEHIAPWPLPTGHRRSVGWINSPPAPIAILADTVATTLNATSDGYDHSGIFLGACVARWLMELVGFPVEGSIGLLLSGGSMANLTALAAARQRACERAGHDLRRDGLAGGPRLTVYASDQTHSSVQKCVELLGLGAASMRLVATDEAFRIRPEALAAMIDADLAAGLTPCAVVANAGATNSGAVDPLAAIADVCAARNVWLHVDGAYGAIGRLDPGEASRFAGMERADSLTLDPHKWFQTPVDCGALLLRDKALQWRTFSLIPAYLASGESAEAPWQFEYSFELTYATRAVKTWAALARLGRAGLSELVCRCNALARRLAAQVAAAPELEAMTPPSLSVLCFRYRPRGVAEDRLDAINATLSRLISESGEAHVPTTKVKGRTCLRACYLHYANDVDDVDHLIALIGRLGQRAVAEA